jgi:adenylate kinase family enzyme
VGRRIAIVGASGNGKSTLGRALAERLHVRYVELDALHHGPGWQEATSEELCARVRTAMDTAGEGWVLDGNYERKLGNLVLLRADTLVWLDQPLPFILARLLRRTLRRIVGRVELWNGNRESWRGAFVGRESLFAWTVRSHFRHRRRLPLRLADEQLAHLDVVRLRTPWQVRRWLARQRPSTGREAALARARRPRPRA